MEDQDWETFHQEEDIDIVEIPPLKVSSNAGALNKQIDLRRTSHAISEEEELEINQMKGEVSFSTLCVYNLSSFFEKLYIIYQSQ